MQSLIQFVYRNYFFFLFLLLQIAALSLFFSRNKFQRSGFLNSANAVAGSLYEQKASITEYLDLTRRNEVLATENAKLKNDNISSYQNIGTSRTFVKDTVLLQQYTFISAKVINSSVNRRNNFITINRGASNGVKPDMGVICGDGIVGFVKHVSEHYATIVPVLNSQFTASVKFKDSNFFGLLNWGGIDPRSANLKDIPKHAEVKEGDELVTRGSSAYYPEGVAIGTVKSVGGESSANYHDIEVNLSTDFHNLDYVYVVDNILKIEQQKIEEQTEEDVN